MLFQPIIYVCCPQQKSFSSFYWFSQNTSLYDTDCRVRQKRVFSGNEFSWQYLQTQIPVTYLMLLSILHGSIYSCTMKKSKIPPVVFLMHHYIMSNCQMSSPERSTSKLCQDQLSIINISTSFLLDVIEALGKAF